MNRITLLALLATILAPTHDPVTGPAGVYTVTTSGPTRVTSGEGWVRIEWDAAEPVVPAPPPPLPEPGPGPVVTPAPPVVVPPVVTTPSTPPPVLRGQVFLLAVYDIYKAEDYPLSQKAILLPPSKGGSATIGPAMKALGVSWKPYNINDPVLVGKAADKSTWRDEAEKQGLPCLIAIGQDGTKVSYWVGPLPADENAALELGKKITGK